MKAIGGQQRSGLEPLQYQSSSTTLEASRKSGGVIFAALAFRFPIEFHPTACDAMRPAGHALFVSDAKRAKTQLSRYRIQLNPISARNGNSLHFQTYLPRPDRHGCVDWPKCAHGLNCFHSGSESDQRRCVEQDWFGETALGVVRVHPLRTLPPSFPHRNGYFLIPFPVIPPGLAGSMMGHRPSPLFLLLA